MIENIAPVVENAASGADRQDSEDLARSFLALGCKCERSENWSAAVESYMRALAADPQDPLVRYFANNNLGYSLLQLGRFDESEQYCEAAIAINPEQYNAHKNHGLACQGQGRWLDAIFSFLEATRLCPSDDRAWRHLQDLLQARPKLLSQSPELRRNVGAVRSVLEAHGYIDAVAGASVSDRAQAVPAEH